MEWGGLFGQENVWLDESWSERHGGIGGLIGRDG